MIMRAIVLFFGLFFLFAGCGNAVEKPDNLIPEDKMVNIIYDLSLLEAMRSQKPAALEQNQINPNKYIYGKYKIDSLQFVKSNEYYASDLKHYKELYEKVAEKLRAQDNQQPVDPKAPQIQ